MSEDECTYFLRSKGYIVVEPDGDSWADWAYEAAGLRLESVGGTDQWKDAYDAKGRRLFFDAGRWREPSYRMAYLAVVLRALVKGQPRNE